MAQSPGPFQRFDALHPLRRGLAAHWPISGGGGEVHALDTVGSAWMGAGANAPIWHYDSRGVAVDFTASNSESLESDAGVLDGRFVSHGTLCAWVRVKSTSANGGIFNSYVDTQSEVSLKMYSSLRRIQFSHRVNGASYINCYTYGSEVLALDTWHFIVYRSKPGGHQIFIDNVQTSPWYLSGNSSAEKFFFDPAKTGWIARAGKHSTGSYLDGQVGNVRTYDYPLEDEELTELFHNPWPEYDRATTSPVVMAAAAGGAGSGGGGGGGAGGISTPISRTVSRNVARLTG